VPVSVVAGLAATGFAGAEGWQPAQIKLTSIPTIGTARHRRKRCMTVDTPQILCWPRTGAGADPQSGGGWRSGNRVIGRTVG
jgi:hypothetical protein